MFPKIRLIKSPEESEYAIEQARLDNDCINFPSHVTERNGEIIGAASLNVLPLMLMWNHSKKISARDTLHLKQVYDSIMETKGFSQYIVACNKSSPYSSHMKKLGFKPVWDTELFIGGI
jgi:hypothetical protein